MRKLLTIAFIVVNMLLQAQPTINMNDMPAVGDTLRTRSSIMGLGIDYEITGNNFTWDFSSLSSNTVGADTFIAVSSTPLVYQLAFNLPFDPNKANLASPQPDLAFIPNLPLTDIMEFYKKANASYGLCGFGATLAGLPIPIKFNSPDIIYKFPLSVSSSPDSTTVSFAQGIPGLGYLSIQKKRVNIVDGWGTMITPAGSYTTLRVKSTVQETDSIYIDSLSFGIAIPRNYIEYKWLANGKGIPVMTVSNENIVPAFTWIDSSAVSSSFTVDAGQDATICEGTSAQVTAVASGGTPPYFYIWSNGTIGATLNVTPTVTTTYTVTATDASFQFTSDAITITVISAPNPAITTIPDLEVGCSNDPLFAFTFMAPAGYDMYTWSTGVSGAGMSTIMVGPPGPNYVGSMTYWVDVVDQFGCAGSDTIIKVWAICDGVGEEDKSGAFSIYPNPSSGMVFVDLKEHFPDPVKVEIFNATGSLVLSGIYSPAGALPSTQVFDLKSHGFRTGLYAVRVSTTGKQWVRTLILD